MESLKLGKKFLEVEYEGETFKIAFPSTLELKEFGVKYGKSKDKGEESLVLLESLGLPRKVMDALDWDSLELIMEKITPSSIKKK